MESNRVNKEQHKLNHNFPYLDESCKYKITAKIGHGSFGEVFKAREKKNSSVVVAMKRIQIERETNGFPISALREINILQQIQHENVIKLIEVCTTASDTDDDISNIFLVFDFCEHDLSGLLKNKNVKFTLGEMKAISKQLLCGIYYLHCNDIIHRDLKPANILITKNGTLKLADFGGSRFYCIHSDGKKNNYTNRIVTLWYRPPEILLGETNYGTSVDLWSIGCIIAQMWTRSPILQGNVELHQLQLIMKLCGSLTPENWPGIENLELYNVIKWPKDHKRQVKEHLRLFIRDPLGLDLVDKFLILNPKNRIDAITALKHRFFTLQPAPSDLAKMLSQHSHSMFEYLSPQPHVQKPEVTMMVYDRIY